METYAISSANLNIIEDNLDYVARELSGVISNVNNVNVQVDGIEEKVTAMDNELKNLVKEIRETAFATNARQNIMYNNEQIEKKYGYYNKVRRLTSSLIDSINNSNINKTILIDQMQKALLTNPNYWLTNAYAALVSWVIDDKQTCDIELKNALNKNRIKTELFFLFINLKYNRIEVAYRWLDAYLNDLNPLKLDQSFVEILELCVNNSLGLKGKSIIIEKINSWMGLLSNNNVINEIEENKWIKYIESKEKRNLETKFLNTYSIDKNIISDNLFITSSYEKILNELELVTKSKIEDINLDHILNKVIYDEDDEEKEFIDDNFKNKLIIECNGDKTKAEKMYNDQKSIYDDKTNLVALFNNITIYYDRYDISDNTRKFILFYSKKFIKKAYEKINKYYINKSLSINIDDFNLVFDDNMSMDMINKEIENYIGSKYNKDDRISWIALILLDLISIVGIYLILSNSILCMLLVILTFIGNGIILYRIIKNIKNTKKLQQSKKRELMSTCEILYAENKDYKEKIESNMKKYDELLIFLDKLNANDYINSTERNIDIG